MIVYIMSLQKKLFDKILFIKNKIKFMIELKDLISLLNLNIVTSN